MADGVRKSDQPNVDVGVGESADAARSAPTLALEQRFLLESPDAFRMIVGDDLSGRLPKTTKRIDSEKWGLPVVDTFARAEAELSRLKDQRFWRIVLPWTGEWNPGAETLLLSSPIFGVIVGGSIERELRRIEFRHPERLSENSLWHMVPETILIAGISIFLITAVMMVHEAVTHDKTFSTRANQVALKKVVKLARSKQKESFSKTIRENPELGLIYYRDYLPQQIQEEQDRLTKEISSLNDLITEWNKRNDEDQMVNIKLLEAQISDLEIQKAKLEEKTKKLKGITQTIQTSWNALKALQEGIELRKKTIAALKRNGSENFPEETLDKALQKAFDDAAVTGQQVQDIIDRKSAEYETDQVELSGEVATVSRQRADKIADEKARRDAVAEVAKLANRGKTTGAALFLSLGIYASNADAEAPTTFPTTESATSIAHAHQTDSHQTNSNQIRNRVTKLNSARLEAARLRSRQGVMRFV